ncbi:MAG: flagellar basal body rod protein FlgB [Firmicutes bacterium]|nr:flagellar basal body rod protein FlgB [Bacillota bacterium]
MNRFLVDGTNLILQLALDAAAERQRVSAHNLANVNTPNFKRQEVSFEEKLKAALFAQPKLQLTRTHEKHLPRELELSDLQHEVVTDKSTSMRPDDNNVDIDREMVLMAMNQMHFNAVTQVLNNRYSALRYILQEGRR